MKLTNLDSLQKYCKDEQALKGLKKTVGRIIEERNQKARQLSLLESAISDHYDGILITEVSLEEPGPEIAYANDEFCKITGYSKDELIGKTPRILQGPKTNDDVLARLKQRLSEGKSFYGKTINYRKDGEEFTNEWDVHPLIDEKGNITHWVSYHHDISEFKQTEEQPDGSKMEFGSLKEESNRTFVEVNLDGDIVSANKAFEELIGYTKDELKEIKAWELFPQRHMESLKGNFDSSNEASFFGGQEFKGIVRHKNGILIQVRGKTKILDSNDQKVIRAEIKSLSLQKRVMKTLKKHLNLNGI